MAPSIVFGIWLGSWLELIIRRRHHSAIDHSRCPNKLPLVLEQTSEIKGKGESITIFGGKTHVIQLHNPLRLCLKWTWWIILDTLVDIARQTRRSPVISSFDWVLRDLFQFARINDPDHLLLVLFSCHANHHITTQCLIVSKHQVPILCFPVIRFRLWSTFRRWYSIKWKVVSTSSSFHSFYISLMWLAFSFFQTNYS